MAIYYKEWTQLDVFSDRGDEVIHKREYLVCVHADDEFLGIGKWSYSIMLPSGRAVYPGTKEKPISFDSKDAAKRSVDDLDDDSFVALQAMNEKGTN